MSCDPLESLRMFAHTQANSQETFDWSLDLETWLLMGDA